MSASWRRHTARAVAGILLTVWVVAVPAAARAHARLDHADPRVGSTGPAPSQVRIWFDAELEPGASSMAVRGPSGGAVGDGHGAVDASDRRLLKADVPPLAPGTYHVTWSAVTSDGHRTSGAYAFTVK